VKDQYVGDVSDFFKYALLRAVQQDVDAPLVVCWMATANDGGRDGRKRRYLQQPEKYRAVDPPLFDHLARLLDSPHPSIAAVEQADILPGASFIGELLEDAAPKRHEYFEHLWRRAPAASIIFFDPDNGLEIKSTPKGRRNSSKYLYLNELAIAGRESRSVIVYQHFGRAERTTYIATQLERMRGVLPDHQLAAMAGTHIAFLIGATPINASTLLAAVDALQAKWPRLSITRAHRP
jgi:hypothetical protein